MFEHFSSSSKIKQFGLLLPFLAFVTVLYFFIRGLSLHPHDLPSVTVGKKLPLFSLPILDGQGTIRSSEIQGQYTLINFWASWCEACVEEQFFLLNLAKTGMPIIGINYKDSERAAKNWLRTWGNPYRLVGADKTGELGINLGVYGTPETFLISPQGDVVYRYPGILNQAIWEREFLPKIQNREE